MLTAGPIPKHHQLSEILRQRIFDEQYVPNDQFPTEEALCREFGVSRGTVPKAVDALVRERLLRREQGRGTFVNPPVTRQSYFTLTSFAEDMRQQHRQPSTRLLEMKRIPATESTAARLHLAVGESVFYIVRLRLADQHPVVYETRHLAESLCPSLIDDDLETQSFHALLVYKYQLPLVKTTHTIEARVLSPEEAEILQARPGAPAFFVDRLTYTVDASGERPAVWYQALYRGDEYHFKTEFQTLLNPSGSERRTK